MVFNVAAPETAEHALTASLRTALSEGHNVLWLVSGGSNVPVSVSVLQSLQDADLRQLIVCLADERYGPIEHADSNYQKLVDAGFDPAPGIFVPVIYDGLDQVADTALFDAVLADLFDDETTVIAQLGIGADGHTSGILPNSPICQSNTYADCYTGPDFERISTTFKALRHIDEAFVFAYGSDKTATLTSLRDTQLDVTEQPSQILKELPKVTVYNDAVEGESK